MKVKKSIKSIKVKALSKSQTQKLKGGDTDPTIKDDLIMGFTIKDDLIMG